MFWLLPYKLCSFSLSVPTEIEIATEHSEAMEGDSDDEGAEEEDVEEPDQEVVRPGDLQGRNQDPTIRKDILRDLNRFHRKQRSGTIDVWWMFDDGGSVEKYILIP